MRASVWVTCCGGVLVEQPINSEWVPLVTADSYFFEPQTTVGVLKFPVSGQIFERAMDSECLSVTI